MVLIVAHLGSRQNDVRQSISITLALALDPVVGEHTVAELVHRTCEVV